MIANSNPMWAIYNLATHFIKVKKIQNGLALKLSA